MNREKFFNIMLALAGNFGASIQPATLDVWYAMAKADGLTYEQVSAAAQKIMRTKTNGYGRMPTYAEILEAIHGQAPSIEHKALSEANRIIAHLNRYGSTVLPDLSDPVTHRLMTTRYPYRSWAAQVLESELKWWAKDFVAAYQAEQITDPQLIPHQVKGLLAQIGYPGDMVPARKSCEGIEALN